MIKTPPRLTPPELRARRIRNAFLGMGTVLLIGLLLAVAWVGSAMRRRIPPTSIPFTSEFAGQLTFDTSVLARLAVEELLPDDEPGKEEIVRQLASPGMREGFHPRAQVLFLEQGERQDWIAYFPIFQPQRYFHRRLMGMLEGAPSLQPLSASTSPASVEDELLGYYQLARRGLLIQSSRERLAPEPVDQPVKGSRLAEYVTTSDYVPEAWLRRLTPIDRIAVETAVVRRIEWHWNPEEGRGEVLFDFDAGESLLVGWFHPLIPRGADE
jgi:hypothetical protein